MFADPDGARVTEKQAVLVALSAGRELFRTLGHAPTTLESIDKTRLDEYSVFLYIKHDVATIVFQESTKGFIDPVLADHPYHDAWE